MPQQPELAPADTVRISARELAELARAAQEAGEVEYLTTEEVTLAQVAPATTPLG